MAITKLTGFTGEAEVMGRMLRVEYSEERGLLLCGLSNDEAMRALDTLALKKLIAVNPATTLNQNVKETTGAPVDLEAHKVMPETQAEKKPAVYKPSTVAKLSEVLPEETKTQLVEVKPEVDVALTPAPQEPKADTKTLADNELPLAKAKQLKDVILILQEQFGIKDVDSMVARCVELQPNVPVLKRITDMPSRVKRAMELLSE